ncbi:adenylate cyclase [Angomonas deanei]|uniref:Adenylate and Guanylate cyclase catalytic domain containing protein, putative n=1 Tax=Angomonas deanei TaxID=59799 RepID=A0A7G2CLD7_9TRYP|nr:adenylate cyclase [Angomonas deanei]CAD2219062.1 Adenylate and Guanylate cyclase catalytic domain containing protein, putative [Angomonas deanei]|eukprot:EPY30465.1 adenylate cyclase [Angomonas deanei]
MDDFGDALYADLLNSNPYIRVFFYGVQLSEQPKALMRMLGTAVYSLNNPNKVDDLFVKTGAKHRGFGVTTETFQSMETSFFKIFPKFIGEDVYEKTKKEWHDFWKYIIKKLDQGNSGREGERYAKLYDMNTLKQLQKDWVVLTERQAKCDTRHQFVGVMYAKAMEMFGDLSKFDALRDLRAASRVFQSYVDIMGILVDKEKSDEYLLELGARHVAYNVTVENLISFTEPFLYACRHFLEAEWNVAMEARFLYAFRYMIDGITAGMVNGMNTMENKRAPQTSEEFCLLFTDIEGSTNLWQKNGHAMGHAVKQHHRLIRSLIAEYGAYEVKTVGDSFIIAAKDVLLGLKIAVAIQLELMRMAPIAPDFEMLDTVEGYGDPACWNKETLRVRIGIEYCRDANATYDTIHRRYDYYGPSVNRCSRIESAACGGQILLSEDTYNVLKATPEFTQEKCEGFFRYLKIPSPSKKLDNSGIDKFIHVEDIGLVKLKGIGEPVHLYSIVPIELKGRKFIDKTQRHN